MDSGFCSEYVIKIFVREDCSYRRILAEELHYLRFFKLKPAFFLNDEVEMLLLSLSRYLGEKLYGIEERRDDKKTSH